jgi:prepilin peptidase CpaA
MDLRARRIPNVVTLPGLVAGLALAGIMERGLPSGALAGAGLALLVSFPLVALGGLGGGDAKLMTAVGAFVGPGGLVSVALYSALAGGLLALLNVVRRRAFVPVMFNVWKLLLHLSSLGRHGERFSLESPGAHSIPYGLAIAVGTMGAWFFPLYW